MTKWAIVAVPENGESVWKTSSEKIPHLTLLNLGDQSDPDLARHIAEYLQHAVTTSVHKFSLNVRNRGLLGDDQADVLFFETSDRLGRTHSIVNFRSQLLKDDQVKKAFDSAEQFPGWTPHLTLGYPGRPAKVGEGIHALPPYAVHFDKIALWVDDFDGPTFELDYENEYAMAMDSLAHRNARRAQEHKIPETSRDVVMRNVLARRKLREPSNLKHHGIGARTVSYESPIDDAVDRTLRKAIKETRALSAQGRFVKSAISGELQHGATTKSKKTYVRENQLAFLRHFEKELGGSPSQRANRAFDLASRPDGDWILSSIDREKHTGTVEVHIRPKLDRDGLITDYSVVHDQMSSDDVSAALMHYGVMGMKWGVRRQRPSSEGVSGDSGPGTKNASSKSRAERKADRKAAKAFDRKAQVIKPTASEEAKLSNATRKRVEKHGTDMMTNKELQSMITRMNLEQQYATLQANGKAKTARSAGKQYAADVLKDVGTTLLKEALLNAAHEGGRRAYDQAANPNSRSRTYVRSEQYKRQQRKLSAAPQRQLPAGRRRLNM